MECNRCHRELIEEQSYIYQGKVFCDDCLMDAGLSTKECDPWATYVDKRSGVQPGMKRAEMLPRWRGASTSLSRVGAG